MHFIFETLEKASNLNVMGLVCPSRSEGNTKSMLRVGLTLT